MQVPNSSGTARPTLSAPPNACDCHMHIYDGGRFPPPRPESRMQPDACVPDYRLFQQRIGTSRVAFFAIIGLCLAPAVWLTQRTQTGGGPAARVTSPTTEHGSQFSERVIAFYSGRVIADGSPTSVLADADVQRYVTGGTR